jgi:hypothetical protein
VNDDPEKPYQFKIDKHIIEKFDDWKEVFASMLIERAFITNGVVQDCDMVMAASNEYRESQDYFAEFVRDCVAKDPKKKIGKSELNLTFTNWYKETYGGGCPSAKDLHNYMDKQFGRQKNQKWEGVRITIYDKERDDLNIPEDVDDDIALFRTSLIAGLGIEYNISGNTSIVAGVIYNNGFGDVLKKQGVMKETNGSPVLTNLEPKLFDLKSMNNFVALQIGILF